jgi:bacterioferritin-associated ferredoxin
MFVCQCEAVTDRQIRGAVAEGCTTVRSVAAVTGAGTGCGGCIPTVRDLVCGSCPSRVVDLPCDDVVVAAGAEVAAPLPHLQTDPVRQPTDDRAAV